MSVATREERTPAIQDWHFPAQCVLPSSFTEQPASQVPRCPCHDILTSALPGWTWPHPSRLLPSPSIPPPCLLSCCPAAHNKQGLGTCCAALEFWSLTSQNHRELSHHTNKYLFRLQTLRSQFNLVLYVKNTVKPPISKYFFREQKVHGVFNKLFAE